MPGFWGCPTVSMGLGPLNAIYQARFMRYLENRGLIAKTARKVWAFVGDGETDEPETLGSISLGSREKLDNLIFLVHCNLQGLDGPVRGNGRIVNELESSFRGAGWNVIKVMWGWDWEPLFAADETGLLIKRMEECVDGELQSFKAKGGAYIRKEFFGKYPELLKLVEHMSDDELHRLTRGGHDPQKVYNAYLRATQHTGSPTVILAQTVKGYGLGSAEARNATHSEKKLADNALSAFRTRFDIPIPESAARDGSLYRPADDSEELKYMRERRRLLGGFMPTREPKPIPFEGPATEEFSESLAGSKGRAVSTTMGYVSMLRQLLKDPKIGKLIVPIIPDEGRTFGMESIIRQVGIYASQGQLYKPHDQDMLLYYREEKNGQILEEGITEAGSMASFTASGTSYSNYNVITIPFFTYYSMFGFQRVGDMALAFFDRRGRGVPQCAPPAWAKDCSPRTAIALCWPAPSRPATLTTRRMCTRLPSSCRTACAACTSSTKTASTTSPCTTKTIRCPRCRRVSKKASCAAFTSSAQPPRARQRCSCLAAAPSSTKRFGRRKFLPRSMAWPPTFGAVPATTNCGATRFQWSGGTGCIPAKRKRSRSS